tara:strand:+ start:359 stop:535 length:177 start_codon:yes stop_codon:yes gene_type:complete
METVLQIIASDTLRNFLLVLIFIMVARSGDAIIEYLRDRTNQELKEIKEELKLLNLHK